jgi:uncharacterized membrane protein SpoIIM required for sporulation
MNEIHFLHKNIEDWERFEAHLNHFQQVPSDKISEMFIRLTDDLAYSRSYFPESNTTHYLNQLAQKAHRIIYQNPATNKNRIIDFWAKEFPLLFYKSRKEFYVSFLVFIVALLIGIVSNNSDDGFSRMIMGDRYINMTLTNIRNGDPLAVYKSMNEVDMFLGITLNNIKVSFFAFAMGLFTPVGVGYILLRNGIMLGTFQSFLADQGFLLDSVATIWVHGTFEIFAIIAAGGAGIIIGNSIIFPKTYTRLLSFRNGALQGSKIIIGLIPIFIVAGFLEGFVTRYTQAPYWIRFSIIGCSLISIVLYFYIYPIYLNKKFNHGKLKN